jgi:hypothetical protein
MRGRGVFRDAAGAPFRPGNVTDRIKFVNLGGPKDGLVLSKGPAIVGLGMPMSDGDPKRLLADWFRQWRVPLRKFLVGRAAVPASATDDVVLKVSALYQQTSSDGLNDVVINPGLKDLQQDYPPGVGAYQKEIQAYDATLTAKLGPVNLTAVSGYSVYEFSDSSWRAGRHATSKSTFIPRCRTYQSLDRIQSPTGMVR